jgi:hypothetical protein
MKTLEDISAAMITDLRENFPQGKTYKHYTERKKAAVKLLTSSFIRTMERGGIDKDAQGYFFAFADVAYGPYMGRAMDKLHPDN